MPTPDERIPHDLAKQQRSANPPANELDTILPQLGPDASGSPAAGNGIAGSDVKSESDSRESDLGSGVTAFLPGEVVANRFRIIRYLAKGGMGELYEAEDLELHERLALKTILPRIAVDERLVNMFKREVHLARQVTHPNVCRIFDVYRHKPRTPGQEVLLLAMELLHGENLADRLHRKGRLPTTEILPLVRQMAAGLTAAHRVGVVHRDFKSQNVMLVKPATPEQEIRAVITDFGLARRSSQDASTNFSMAAAGEISGTPAYMAPEQLEGGPVTPATDVYALGVVLYEMATGVWPFIGDTPLQTAIKRLKEPAPAPRIHVPDMDVRWQAAILRCLERDPAARFASAESVVAALEDSQEAKALPPVGHLRRNAWKLFAAGVVVLALVLAIFTIVKFRSRGPKLTEKDTIVLADFTNTTGESIFDASLKQAARLDLQQTPFLNVLPDSDVDDVLKRMTRPANQRLTEKIAREVCLRSNSAAYITGSIANSGSGYLVGMKAVSCTTEQEIARSEVEAADRSKVIQSLGKADDQLRRKLGESLASLAKFNRPLTQATTSSLEALHEFTEGVTRYPFNQAEAILHYRRAIELDPNFARAYSGLANAYRAGGQYSSAIENSRRAYELRDRVSDRERFYIMAAYLWNVTGEAPEGQKVAEEWVRLYPNDQSAYASLAADYLILGEFDKAAQACRKSLSLGPPQISAYANSMMAYQRLERYDEAKTIYNTARARNIENQSLRLSRYTIAFLENDDAGMKEQIEWAQGKKGSYNLLLGYQASAEAYYGHYALSRESSKKAVVVALSDGATDRSLTHEVDAAVDDVEVGSIVQARGVAAKTWPLTISNNVRVEIAYILAKIGDNAGAERLADQLDRDRPLDTRTQRLSLPIIRALIELNKNNPEKAVVLLQPALQFERADGHLGGLLPAYVRGLAYLQAGKGPEAASEFQKLIDHPGIVSISVRGALARLQLARAKELSGDHASARRSYQDFLALWKDADPDIPIFKQAQAEYARLK